MHGQWSALHMIWTQPSTFTPRPGQDVEPPQPNHPGAEAWTSGTCGWLGFRHGSPPSACNTACIFDNIYIWGFPEIGVPKNGWCIIETPTKIDDLGVHSVMETPIYIYIHTTLSAKMIKIQSKSRTITDVWGPGPGWCPFNLSEIVSLAVQFFVQLVATGLKINQGPGLGFWKDLFQGLALFDGLAIFDHLQICC